MKKNIQLTNRFQNTEPSIDSISKTSPLSAQIRQQESTPQRTKQMASSSTSSTNGTTNRTDVRAVKLMVEPFQFLSYVEWDISLGFNEHGTLKIKGLVAEKNRMRYLNMASRETWVCVKALDENDEEVILFQGILTKLNVDSMHEHHTMSIEVKTGTHLLDQRRHTRTFQPDNTAYYHVINTCVKEVGGEFTMRERRDQETGRLTVQYEETNWSFINRLAHRLGVVVLPEFKTQGKRFHLGLNQNSQSQEIKSDNYQMESDLANPDSLIRYEHGIYHVRTRSIYELGQSVTLQGRKMVIINVKSYLKGGELVHTYTLGNLKSTYERPLAHEAIKGVSMMAQVTAVERDRLQVSIFEDENKSQSGSRWFDYSTIYSSPDGTGLFFHPEVGDTVRVVFPNANETSAYVANSVHLETHGGRTNPDHKSIKNKHNKEVILAPDFAKLTNNAGLDVELNDAKGIMINSNQGIFIETDGNLHISSDNAGVTIYGDRTVTIQQGSAQINMKDGVDVAGGKINMN